MVKKVEVCFVAVVFVAMLALCAKEPVESWISKADHWQRSRQNSRARTI